MFPWIPPCCGPRRHPQCPSCPHLPSQLQPPLKVSLPPGFRRKEFRGKLAIAITANFINRNTTAEAKVEEISGVAFIFNQKFFQELREATGGRGCLRELGFWEVPTAQVLLAPALSCSSVSQGLGPSGQGLHSCLGFYLFVLPPSSLLPPSPLWSYG